MNVKNACAALLVNGECRCSERRVKLNANVSEDHAGEGRCAERENLGFGRDIHWNCKFPGVPGAPGVKCKILGHVSRS